MLPIFQFYADMRSDSFGHRLSQYSCIAVAALMAHGFEGHGQINYHDVNPD
jgi:hypothetical protein